MAKGLFARLFNLITQPITVDLAVETHHRLNTIIEHCTPHPSQADIYAIALAFYADILDKAEKYSGNSIVSAHSDYQGFTLDLPTFVTMSVNQDIVQSTIKSRDVNAQLARIKPHLWPETQPPHEDVILRGCLRFYMSVLAQQNQGFDIHFQTGENDERFILDNASERLRHKSFQPDFLNLSSLG